MSDVCLICNMNSKPTWGDMTSRLKTILFSDLIGISSAAVGQEPTLSKD